MTLFMQRREILQAGTLVLLLGASALARGARIVAVRVWPAQDYTRITIESDTALIARSQFVPDPPRLAVDIEGIDLVPALRGLVAKIRTDDPFIAGARVGQNAPGVVRLVIDLKQPAAPQVFALAPVHVGLATAYGHRLVFDLYPSHDADPLEALIAQRLPGHTAGHKAEHKAPLPRDPLEDWLDKNIPATTKTDGPKPPPSPVTQPGEPASLTDRMVIIAIDPGHGGEDPGAIGPGGTREKDVVLQIAQRLRDLINREEVPVQAVKPHTNSAGPAGRVPMRAFLTRDADYFVPLQVRVQKARRVRADLFVSIHADAFMTPTARGASIFALSPKGASSASAKWMADKENQADQIGGLNIRASDAQVQRTLLDMSTTAQINDSLKLGSSMLGEISGIAKLHKTKVEQAGFAVLKAPDIPSVLVETAFISNPEEEARLSDETYQDQLAAAILRGIKRYFSRNPPMGQRRAL